MKPIGNLAIALLWLLFAQLSLAEVDASLDRYQAALGDTLNLTVTVTEDDEDLSDIDLALIARDFEVLNQSTRSSTQIINGQRNHQRQLILNITPLRTGTLQIPALRSGSASSKPLTVEVGEPVQIDPGQESVLFEAVLDRESVYVQGQLLLTLRLQQSVNLNQRSISELQLDDAFVLPLEQRSFQRNVGGRPWLVHEVRYAIFPEQSGTLSIPSQTFSAREGSRIRGRLVRMQTPALDVEVLPRPATYPAGATWLPAQDLRIEEQWSSDPQQLSVGGSVTRSIRLVATGLQGAQLPPVNFEAVDGIKLFPDQPAISDSEVSGGKRGVRSDSAALVATRSGQFTLPEIRIPWWDIEAEQLRYAILPARTIEVAPAPATAVPEAPPAATDITASQGQVHGMANPIWPWLTALFALGWITTAWAWWRSSRAAKPAATAVPAAPASGKSFKSLLAACSANQPAQARQWLLHWATSREPKLAGSTLADICAYFDDEALASAVADLDRHLYSATPDNWRGDQLAAVVKQLQKRKQKDGSAETGLPSLYPAERASAT